MVGRTVPEAGISGGGPGGGAGLSSLSCGGGGPLPLTGNCKLGVPLARVGISGAVVAASGRMSKLTVSAPSEAIRSKAGSNGVD